MLIFCKLKLYLFKMSDAVSMGSNINGIRRTGTKSALHLASGNHTVGVSMVKK